MWVVLGYINSGILSRNEQIYSLSTAQGASFRVHTLKRMLKIRVQESVTRKLALQCVSNGAQTRLVERQYNADR